MVFEEKSGIHAEETSWLAIANHAPAVILARCERRRRMGEGRPGRSRIVRRREDREWISVSEVLNRKIGRIRPCTIE